MLMAQCAPTDQEGVAGTRRQRAVHRVRRRRPRRRGRGRDGLASTATPARPASAPTASACRTASTTRSPQKLAAAVDALKVGNGIEAGVDAGPADRRRRRSTKVEEHIADARRKGARVVLPAASATRWAAPSSSRPCSPTCTTDDDGHAARRPSARWRRCSASRPRTRRSQLANDTEFGLAAYFYARDIGRVLRVAEALEYGMVGINDGHDLHRGRAVRRRQGSPASAARARSTASRTTSRSSTSAWAGSSDRLPPFRPRVGRARFLCRHSRESGNPYVDGPLPARGSRVVWIGSLALICPACWARSHMTAGRDGIRDAGSEQGRDVWHRWIPRSVRRLGSIDHTTFSCKFRPWREVRTALR